MNDKEKKLRAIIGSYNKVAIAFSGGVDSTLLAAAAKIILGESKVELFTVSLHMTPDWERRDAVAFASQLGLSHHLIPLDELAVSSVAENPPDRCYHCKKVILLRIMQEAKKLSCDVLFDGSNRDDQTDYRPGLKAVKEAGVVSPLSQAGFTKDEIRRLSERYMLPSAQKPSGACLGSRIPYGNRITEEMLRKVEVAEQGIRRHGFDAVRVRVHGECARIEIEARRLEEAWRMRDRISSICKQAGFAYVAFDPIGYVSGSLNACLKSG